MKLSIPSLIISFALILSLSQFGFTEQDPEEDVNSPYSFGDLTSACLRNNPEKIKEILTKQPELIHEKTKIGNALHYSCLTGQVEATRLLIQMGADVDGTSAAGHTPLWMSALTVDGLREQSMECAKMLLKAGASVDGVVPEIKPENKRPWKEWKPFSPLCKGRLPPAFL